MSRLFRLWPMLLAFALVFTACFHEAILGGQFSYRDAAHFYYPLYKRVQTEWEAGRWPLWEPEENAGIPLLGNPTAAVLYPGKLIYAALPYPVAARVYTMAHVALAFVGAYALARHFGVGAAGAGVSGLSYAFGSPILFQYCNIIFLVGAAWTPFALRAAAGWIESRNRRAPLELAVALAMQVLGGEPQSAYLVGLCAAGYAWLFSRASAETPTAETEPKRRRWTLPIVLFVLALWTAGTLTAAVVLPGLRPTRPVKPVATFSWTRYVPLLVMGMWGLAALRWLRGWRRGEPKAKTLVGSLTGLALAAALSGALAAAQLLPVSEFTSRTSRAADEGSHDFYPFSLEPVRLAEFLFPNVYGTAYQGNRYWMSMIPPLDATHRIWVPSLYVGGPALILGLAAFGFRSRPIWVKWFAAILFLSLLASLGEFGGPLFWARRRIPGLGSVLGPVDGPNPNAIRLDRHLRDGDGSFYWFLTVALPGFHSFRYPSKLLSFGVLALGVLAGAGWDRVVAGERRRAGRLGLAAAVLGLTGTAVVVAARGPILAWFERAGGGSAFGPFQAVEALAETRWSTIQATLVALGTVGLLRLAGRRPAAASAALPFLLAVDLAIANDGSILTAPQAEFDKVPRYLEVIREAERANPSPGPYRIHRMPVWSPAGWNLDVSDDRVLDFLRWERDTLQPKYGINHGVEYTYTQGTAELYDYEWFFSPFDLGVSPALASILGKIGTHERVIYYPRRGFDLWNTRYFVLPGYTVWTDTERGVASFLHEVEPIYPPPGHFSGPDREKRQVDWARDEDVQIFRNRRMFPRTWLVHEARFRPPVTGLTREQRREPVEQMLYAGDAVWNDPDRAVVDMRRVAWIESADSAALRTRLQGADTHPDEYTKIVRADPQRVELEVLSPRSGIVVLADAFYPGWRLTIDETPAEILRTNRMMRGAFVDGSPKVRKLVYTYEPDSFKWGLRLSVVGLGVLLVGGVSAWRRPRP